MEFERAGVIGAGTMGVGIGYVLALSGARVWLVEPDERQTSRAARALQERADLAVLHGSPTVPSAELVDRVEWRSSVADLPLELDVIVEAVPERFDLKRGVLAAAQDRDPRLLGSNTSGLAIGSLASALKNPSALVGLHFFQPGSGYAAAGSGSRAGHGREEHQAGPAAGRPAGQGADRRRRHALAS